MKHISKIFLAITLLVFGVGNIWAGAGFWDNGGITLTFSFNGSDVTRTLNSSSQGGTTSLGTVTTGISLKTISANVWKDGSGNICGVSAYYRIKNSGGTIIYDKSGSATALSWKSNDGNNQVWEKSSINDDLLNGGLAPGTYTFECWFNATGNDSGTSGCGSSFWYSKGGSNYSYTFIVPSKSLTVSGAANGNTVSGSVSGITKGVAYTITATPTTGYTFSGWTATSGGSSITIANASSASTTVTFNNYSNNATVTASFVAETTHNVTISYLCTSPSKSIRDNDTQAIGVTTHTSITAPTIYGYTFSGWTVGSGLNNHTGNTTTNPIEVTTKASGTYTLQANYTEDLTSTCTLKGSFDSWGAGVAMTKKTGHSAEYWVYATRNFTGSTTTTELKVLDGSDWYGKNSTTITKTAGSLTKSVTGLSTTGANMNLQHLVTGTYEIAYNISTHEMIVTWPDVNQIQITYGDESTPAGYYDFDGVSGTVYSKAFTFSRDHRYSAKIIYHSDFYTFDNTGDMTVDNHTDWRVYNNQNKICNVWAPVAGTYTYRFNSNNGGNTTLTVEYPSFFRLYYDSDNVNPDVTDSIAVWPVIYPAPGGTTKVCWELLYNSGNAVPDHDAVPSVEPGHQTNQVRFYIGDLAAGTYKVRATLHSGTTCDGSLLNTAVDPFYVVSDYNVTIKYMCDDQVIKTQTTMTGNPLSWTDITAPDIVGYTFSTWHAGDGITLQKAATTKANAFKADYGGTLTAVYTKRRVIYFNNTFSQWSSVNVYFYKNNSYWDNSNGTGSDKTYTYTNTPYSEGLHGAMTQIDGTNIWYFDCETAGVNAAYTTVAFTEKGQDDYGFFSYQTGTTPNKVIRRDDYNSAALPMFVPITQTGTLMNGGQARYYNEGYWMNYPENTGYTLRIYDRISEDGAVEVATIPFEFTEDKTLPMSLNVLLDAAHTYGYKVERADNVWLGNNGTMQDGNSGDVGQDPWALTSGTAKCGLLTTAAGIYTFTLSYGNSSGYNYIMGIHYPAQVGDFRVVYKDLATWSQSTAHTASWGHPSRVILHNANAKDTVSFFVSKGYSPTLQVQKITAVNASTGAITWANVGSAINVNSVDEAGVYNFKITQNADGTSVSSVENIGAYTGNYYIRGGAFNNKWENFISDHDHLMTYSEFSESDENSFGDKYSHYKAKWCPRGTNVKFCIANDYSLAISDTLLYDVPNTFSNINSDGTLKSSDGGDPTADKYSANIRFMWNRKTNKISRAYVASSTNVTKRFLVLAGCDGKLHDAAGNAIAATANLDANSVLLQDDQNWIYETTVTAQPTARVKLYACYAKDPIDLSKAQYFRGPYDSGNCGSNANSIQILGGSGSTYYTVRIIYDFKTNRLVCAWMPDGSDIDTDLHIQADVMVVRDHQESAQCITFANDASKLSEVKTVYGTMRFNRWTLNNRARGLGGVEDNIKEHANHTDSISKYHPVLSGGEQKSVYERASYFISFPFDVNLGEVFGFGKYGTHWIISEYNGLRRAHDGYFYDNCHNWDCTNWDYIMDPTGITLHAYQGYLLQLDLDLMQYDDTTEFWLNQIHQVELYFPSTTQVSTIATTSATMPALGDEYICTINHNQNGDNPEGDRRVKDSYWRCIGVPSYADYGTVLKTSESGSTITWQTNYSWRANFRDYPFLYEWNVTDNSLSAQATSTYTFKAMHAYLVQNGNAIYWQAVNTTPSPIVARRQRQYMEDEFLWRLTLSSSQRFEDQAYIRMTNDELVTDTFDLNQDLAKEEKTGYANLYSLIGYERAAANSLTLNTTSTTIVPLGVSIPVAGEYTFALPDGAQGAELTLMDDETGKQTNLSAGMTYTVTLNAGQTDNRFRLEITTQNTPTDIENTNDVENETNRNIRKVLINGVLYIVRDEHIYDARGIMVK